MTDFLEERFSDLVRYGSSWQDEFAVRVIPVSGGNEYRSLIHPYPVRSFDVSYLLDSARTWSELLNVWQRAHGRYAGFRIRCFDEYSTNGPKGAPTAFDQSLALVSAGVYQLRKFYGTDKSAGAAGYSCRTIRKPVASTTRAAIGSVEIATPLSWSVDTTNGQITFAADKSYSITSIGQSSSAVIVLATSTNTIADGESVYISGVAGMTQINSLRVKVLYATTNSITVDLNTTAFGTYTSGGVVHTRPQSGESVTGGCEFDFPVRFSSELPVSQDYPGYRPVEGVTLREILNP